MHTCGHELKEAHTDTYMHTHRHVRTHTDAHMQTFAPAHTDRHTDRHTHTHTPAHMREQKNQMDTNQQSKVGLPFGSGGLLRLFDLT